MFLFVCPFVDSMNLTLLISNIHSQTAHSVYITSFDDSMNLTRLISSMNSCNAHSHNRIKMFIGHKHLQFYAGDIYDVPTSQGRSNADNLLWISGNPNALHVIVVECHRCVQFSRNPTIQIIPC